jgi:hypothetical protein
MEKVKMHKFTEPKQSSYPYHVAVCGKLRGKVQTSPLAAQEDASKLGPYAKVVPMVKCQAQRYIDFDRLTFGTAAVA